MSAGISTDAPADPWPILRAAVAAVAAQHWRALRRMAPAPDPRCVAAETVASQACTLVQSPVLWEALHALSALLAGDPRARSHTTLTVSEFQQLNRQIEALDFAAASWAGYAYAPALAKAGERVAANDP